jgi:hypothetical protein
VPAVATSPTETGFVSGRQAGLPPSEGIVTLRRLLDSLRQQTRRWIWVESLALVCLAGAAVFWAALAFDWLIEPPAWVRAAWAVATVVGLAALLRSKLFGRLATPLDDAALATVVERGHAGFRDSLSTAIELSGGGHEDVDPTLLGRTVAEAVSMVDQVSPAVLFRRRRLVGLAILGIGAAASIGGLALAQPAIADLWVQRMVWLGDDPWPRRTSLSIEGFSAGRRKVARGSDVDIVVKADARKIVPEVVDLRSRGAAGWRTDRMGMRGGVADDLQAFGHVLKSVNEDLLLEVRGGDARLRHLALVVVDAPALESLEIRYTLPTYLGGGTRQVAASRIVQIPRGSTVEIACTATKPLSAATITAAAEGREETLATLPAHTTASEPAATEKNPPPTAAGGRIAARIDELDGERTVVVQLTDTDGLVNQEPISFVLAALPDEPPQVAVRMLGISTAVTPRATIPLEGTISDDHGLAAAAVTLAVAEGGTSTLPIANATGNASLLEMTAERPYRVAIEPLGLAPGRTLSLVVTAQDGCTLDGQANTGSGDTWTLDVVAPEALLAMLEAREIILRRRYESCIADLTQVRDRLAGGGASAPDPTDSATAAAARLGEAAARAAGETAEIAAAFRMIRVELDNNLLLTPELETRLIIQIADPLAGIAAKDLPALSVACRGSFGPAELVSRTDEVLARMRAVLDKMMELESFNEVVELLRGMIRTQEEIRIETLKRQKQRAREALERP